MAAIFLVTVILLGSFSLQSRDLSIRLRDYEARIEVLKREIDAEHSRTEEIYAQREHMNSDEFAEQIAREKLGLVKDNEIVFEEEN
ncbi:MAG: septum formation initiator family protein [Clostridiales bacterium]|nr:septum formation initiator family protein [Candidatus Blautia equi]